MIGRGVSGEVYMVKTGRVRSWELRQGMFFIFREEGSLQRGLIREARGMI